MDQPTVIDHNSKDRSHGQNDGVTSASQYKVLARKYRPTTFAALIGQDALVRTLTNAITSGRLAHGYMLTGVRGVGKTTTARLIARALNCIGDDGKGGPTPEPCGVCSNCMSIAQDRHQDVLEMDAASRTGIDDIRELLEGVRYRPVSARYKIYIVDEVHMLSDKAFNALLKTLEEPPEHVKFIFATTEIRKVPVTVLSRCQRFDLRRIDNPSLKNLFGNIIKQEKVNVEDAALGLIARAADGSARDGLSILDQAISQSSGMGTKQVITELMIRDMLGLADRALLFDLFAAVMSGNIKTALDLVSDQYDAGASPLVIIQDLLELVHWLTRLKVAPDSPIDATLTETDRARGVVMAEKLPMATLTRAWQMLLKGLSETRMAPMPMQAAEMVILRMVYSADFPSPADVIKKLQNDEMTSAGTTSEASSLSQTSNNPPPSGGGSGTSSAQAKTLGVTQPKHVSMPRPTSFSEVVTLFAEHREATLATYLKRSVRLVRFTSGLIEINPGRGSPPDLAGQTGKLLTEWTGQRWLVSVVSEQGEETIYDQELAQAKSDPLVKSILDAFPGAKIEAVNHTESD